jgi:hypothetical protein
VSCLQCLKCSYVHHLNHDTPLRHTMRLRFPVTENHPRVSIRRCDPSWYFLSPTALQWFFNQLNVSKKAKLKYLDALISSQNPSLAQLLSWGRPTSVVSTTFKVQLHLPPQRFSLTENSPRDGIRRCNHSWYFQSTTALQWFFNQLNVSKKAKLKHLDALISPQNPSRAPLLGRRSTYQ